MTSPRPPPPSPQQDALSEHNCRKDKPWFQRVPQEPVPTYGGARGPAWSFPQGTFLLQNGPPSPACFPTPGRLPCPPASCPSLSWKGRRGRREATLPVPSQSRGPGPGGLGNRMETAPLWKRCPPRNSAAKRAMSGGFLTSSAPQAKNLQAVAVRLGSHQGGRPGAEKPAADLRRHAPPLRASLLETLQPDPQQLLRRGAAPLAGDGGLPDISFPGLWTGRSAPVSTLWFPRKQDPGPPQSRDLCPDPRPVVGFAPSQSRRFQGPLHPTMRPDPTATRLFLCLVLMACRQPRGKSP